MKERLQKILSRAGVSSRRAAEEIILAGRVTVNGVVISEMGAKADPDHDTITVDGKRLGTDIARVYIVLYKPSGYMTTLKDPQGRPLVTDLLKGIRERVYPVGRLDYNTEGVLLLTNDGEWANALAHPRHEVDKEYHVRVQGQVSPVQIQRLTAGVELEDGMTAPALVRVIRESDNNTWRAITIHEGRYRQVRRMCEAVSLSVVRLKRARYGFLGLEGLTAGKFRFLTSEEAERLRQSSRGERAVLTPAPLLEKRREQKTPEKNPDGKNSFYGKKRNSTAPAPEKSRGRRRQP